MPVADIDPLELLTTKQAARRSGLSEWTLLKMRKEHRGIPYVKIGGHTVRYRTADVDAYLREHLVVPGEAGKPAMAKPAQAVVHAAAGARPLPHLRGGRFS